MLDIKKIIDEFKSCNNIDKLIEIQKKYIGKNGIITTELKKIKDIENLEEKKEFGQKISKIKDEFLKNYKKFENKLNKIEIDKILNNDIVDIFVETKKTNNGNYSLLSNVRRDLEEICRSFGFLMEYGNEIVTKFENFESVNIPLTHPATEMQDTIYLKEKDNFGENMILRTQTSSMQNYMIKKYGVPLKAVMPGKVYRYENIDATHDTMFYQLEGMIIDKNISIAHFRNLISKLLSKILKSDVEIRMRPGYFPFVEPGFEIDAKYKYYNDKTGKYEKSDWVEILGAGMIHPNVLEEANIDKNEYTGFAFGIGINRIAAIRYGIKDIRYFTNGDLRFAKSFV